MAADHKAHRPTRHLINRQGSRAAGRVFRWLLSCWLRTEEVEMGRFVTLVEVGPRDGLQNEPVILSTEAKLAFIGRALDAGLKHIEAVSFVNPKKVPAMADAEAVMAGVPRDRGAVYCGLVLNQRGFERAVAAGCDEILFVTSSTDSFSLRNQGMPVADAIAAWRRVAHEAAERRIRAS